jgi:predicted PurR-regulated permease PerM
MSNDPGSASYQRMEIAAVVFMAVALVATIKLHLLPALFAGLLIHELVHMLAPRMFGHGSNPDRAKLVALALLITLVVIAVSGAVVAMILFFRSDAGSLSALLQKMAEIIETSRNTLPGWIRDSLPTDAQELKDQIAAWLREHAKEVKTMGGEAGRGIAYALIGMAIGALISRREARHDATPGPLAAAVGRCAERLSTAFRRVVFAQVRISALNTALTAIYLVVVLPLLGIHLPLSKSMILITFLAGLLPVLGNLISNTVIVVISLSYSLNAAIGSLVFLVVIHKLEYFINARIVGSQIQASAWELLLAMLVMESAFGLPGVIAAPVFYAYVKSEFTSRELV